MSQCLSGFRDRQRNRGERCAGRRPISATVVQECGNVTKNAIPFPVLSDADVSASKAFGLAFQVDPTTLGRYKGFGIDLEKASGASHHALPIPAVYIVDQSGKVAYAHSNPDYRERLDTKTIIGELEKLK